MTVIFHTNAGAPVLAGDMLLSVHGPHVHTELRLPSQPGGIITPSDTIPSWVPVKMRRKVFVVNDHMAVGGAGSVSHIRRFIDDLFGQFHDRHEFRYSEITDFLARYASSQRGGQVLQKIGVIILVEATDGRGSLTGGNVNPTSLTSQQFGKVVTIGSGARSVAAEIQRLDSGYLYGESQPPDAEATFPEFQTLNRNLTLLANLYWKEFASPDNVFNAWGGAYDIVYQDTNATFRHLEEYTIFLRMFDVDRSNEEIQLMNVLKYERRPEVSLIAMLYNEKLEWFGAKDIAASDEPISVRVGGDTFTMNSRLHISIIAVGKGNWMLRPMIQIDGLDPVGNGRQTVFTQFDDEGRLRVLFHAEHDDWLREQAIAYYERNAHRLP